MKAAIQEGIRNGVPPFALCHLIARRHRLFSEPRKLRLMGPVSTRFAGRTPGLSDTASQMLPPFPAMLLASTQRSGYQVADSWTGSEA